MYTEKDKHRFHTKYSKLPSGCWEWQAAKMKGTHPYGFFGHQGMKMAHRVSYEIHKGTIPTGLEVLHSCDNPSCVNPDHLSVGTHKQNMADAAARGRMSRSSRPERTTERTNEQKEATSIKLKTWFDCPECGKQVTNQTYGRYHKGKCERK